MEERPNDDTLTLDSDRDESRDASEPRAALVCVFEGGKIGSSVVHSLLPRSRVAIGRGPLHTVVRRDGLDERRVRIDVNDTHVSREHCGIELDAAGQAHAFDRGSRNGTFVNGARVDGKKDLADGDVVGIGETSLVFRAVRQGEGGPLDHPPLDPIGAPRWRTLNRPFAEALQRVRPILGKGIAILLEGEPGTGKEQLARAIHELSGRSGDLVSVNCGAIADTLFETEFFGAKKGAFSDAKEDRLGLVRAAHKGTLFLDEVGELSAKGQVALLRVLQEREVLPVGATQTIAVDLAVLAATNRPLDRAIDDGAFRRDLFGRLAGLRVSVPPLRARIEDLALLLPLLAKKHGVDAPLTVRRDLAWALLRAPWPGNVRELEAALAVALAIRPNGAIERVDFPGLQGSTEPPRALSNQPSAPSVPVAADERVRARRDELAGLLAKHSGNVSAVAREMGRVRSQVQQWIRDCGLDPNDFR